MSKKRIILAFLNLFFICVAVYTIYVFSTHGKEFSADELIKNSILKQKEFSAKVEEIETQRGINAWLMEEHSAPIVSLSFYFDEAGFGFEPEEKQGLSQMVAELLLYSTRTYSYETLHDLIETNAVSVSFDTAYETFNGSLTFPKTNIKTAQKILKSVLSEPSFEPKYIRIIRDQMIEMIKIQDEKPEKVIYRELKKQLYESHPKSRQAIGKINTVSNISQQDLKDFIKHNLKKNNLHIGIAGDISKQEAIDMLDFVFGDMKQSQEKKSLPDLKPDYTFPQRNIKRDMPQVISYFVALGAKRLSPDFYALYMANEVFGGSGLSSRLNLRAREKEGLTYGAYSYLNSQKDAPQIIGTFSCAKENYQRIVDILYTEWEKMLTEGVSQKEFETVKKNMLASFNLRFKSISDIAQMLSLMQKENLGTDFLEKRNTYVKGVTLEQVNAAAKKYFKTKPSILTIGNNNQGD